MNQQWKSMNIRHIWHPAYLTAFSMVLSRLQDWQPWINKMNSSIFRGWVLYTQGIVLHSFFWSRHFLQTSWNNSHLSCKQHDHSQVSQCNQYNEIHNIYPVWHDFQTKHATFRLAPVHSLTITSTAHLVSRRPHPLLRAEIQLTYYILFM